jgi:hypothetical protein
VDGGGEFAGLGGQFPGVGEPVAADLPFGKPAGAPFAEVLLGDGGPVKLLLEDGLDVGTVVEPAEDLVALDIIIEAAVEFVTDVAGQALDYSPSGS